MTTPDRGEVSVRDMIAGAMPTFTCNKGPVVFHSSVSQKGDALKPSEIITDNPPTCKIELTNDQAVALWNWSQDSDVAYWEIAGLAQVVARCKEFYLYEQEW